MIATRRSRARAASCAGPLAVTWRTEYVMGPAALQTHLTEAMLLRRSLGPENEFPFAWSMIAATAPPAGFSGRRPASGDG